MDHISFAPYHNRHIEFTYEVPGTRQMSLSGVVLDILQYNQKESPTEYVFISSNNLIEWRNADTMGDERTKERLQQRIDIRFVRNPRHIQFTR